MTAVQLTPTAVPDAHVLTPALHSDDRGTFLEWFRSADLEEAPGTPSAWPRPTRRCRAPGSCAGSTSPTCRRARPSTSPASRGAVLDVVVDVRVGVPDLRPLGRRPPRRPRAPRPVHRRGPRARVLRARARQHRHLPLQRRVPPGSEHGVHPLDPALGIAWPGRRRRRCSAPRTPRRPTLAEAREAGDPAVVPGCVRALPRRAAAERTASGSVPGHARDHPRRRHRHPACTRSPGRSASS